MAGVMAEAARPCNHRPFASDCQENCRCTHCGASRASADRNVLSVLTWRQDHDHLATLEFRLLLDLRHWTDIVLPAVQQFGAQLLVRHFTAAKAQGDFDLIAVLEEALHRAHFY